MEAATFTESDWPCTTAGALADLERNSQLPPEQVNQSVLTLIRARKAINDARLAVSAARRANKDRAPVSERLDTICATLGKLSTEDFPLTILKNGGNKPRPKIFKSHDVDPLADYT